MDIRAWKNCPTCGGTHKWTCDWCGFGVAGLEAPATHKDERGRRCDVKMRPCPTCAAHFTALKAAEDEAYERAVEVVNQYRPYDIENGLCTKRAIATKLRALKERQPDGEEGTGK